MKYLLTGDPDKVNRKNLKNSRKKNVHIGSQKTIESLVEVTPRPSWGKAGGRRPVSVSPSVPLTFELCCIL